MIYTYDNLKKNTIIIFINKINATFTLKSISHLLF